jgi:hypothetical protein
MPAERDVSSAKVYGLTHDELQYILDPMELYGPDSPANPSAS